MKDLIIGSIPLLTAFITGIIFWNQLTPTWLKLVPWFLFLVFTIQIIGYLYSDIFKKSNHFIFNCYIFIESNFYFFIFYNAINKQKLKKIIQFIILFYILLYIYKIFVLNHFFIYSSLMANVGDFFVLCCGFIYLTELLLTDMWVNYFTIPMFWITVGVLISAVGNFLYLAFLNYIIQSKLDPEGKIYGVIMTTISVVEYSLFTVAFLPKKIWTKTK